MKKNFSFLMFLLPLSICSPVFNYSDVNFSKEVAAGIKLIDPSGFDKFVEDLNNVQTAFQDLMADFNGENMSGILVKLANLKNAAGVYQVDRNDQQGTKFADDINTFATNLLDAIKADPRVPPGLATLWSTVQIRIVQETVNVLMLKVQQIGDIPHNFG